jgi:dienelactone hydrolase
MLVVRPYARAAVLIVRATDIGGWPGRLATLAVPSSIVEHDVVIETRHGPMTGRVYESQPAIGPTALLVPGINPAGVDEPRLIAFARTLAASGVAVVTVAPNDLVMFRVTADDTDRIEDALQWLVTQPLLTTRGRPGVIGVSFAGGLAIVAAGRPAVRHRLAFVVSLGGHGDLPRVLRFLCTGELADGTRAHPQDYGTAVVLLNVIDRLVPPAQVEPLRAAILAFIDASTLGLFDPSAARRAFDRVRVLEAALPEPAATWMRRVRARDVKGSGPQLLPHALAMGADPALSPERSSTPAAPVFLLHGIGDTLIPTLETDRLASWLQSRTAVRALVTPLVAHTDIAPEVRFPDAWRAVAFWQDVLSRR